MNVNSNSQQSAQAQQQQQQMSSSSASTTSSSGGNSDDLMSSFMAMFTASLMNQDPTAPMDASEMTSQLAQISSLDQQELMNKKLTQLIGITENVGNMVLMGLVGSDAKVAVSKFDWDSTVGGTVDGTIVVKEEKLKYDYKIDVLDEHGNVVDTIDAEVKNGKLVYEWGGTDSEGNRVPSGEYQFEVYYEDVNGGKIVDDEALVTVTSTITRMTFFPSSSMGLNNGMNIDNAAILAVIREDGEEVEFPPELNNK